MSGRVSRVNRIVIAVAVEVGCLVEVGVSRDEPSDLSIVVAGADVAQPGVAFSSVAALCAVHVGIGTAAKGLDRIAEAIEVDPRHLRLAGVGNDTLVALAIKERDLAVLADEAIAVSIGGGRGAALLFDQDMAVSVVELVRRAAVGARNTPTSGIVGKAALDAASGTEASGTNFISVLKGP